MNFEYQLNSTDYEEAFMAALSGSSESENQTIHNRSLESKNRNIHKWVLLIGVFFLLMGIVSQEKGFLVVGIILVSMPIFCKLFVQVEEIYTDVESDIGVDLNRERPKILNPTNWGEPTTVEVREEGLVLNTPSWQGTFKWDNFEYLTETRNLLVIYPVSSLYPVPESNFIIPKRAFSSEEQWSDFREFLHKNIGKRRYNLLKKMQKQFFNLKSKI